MMDYEGEEGDVKRMLWDLVEHEDGGDPGDFDGDDFIEHLSEIMKNDGWTEEFKNQFPGIWNIELYDFDMRWISIVSEDDDHEGILQSLLNGFYLSERHPDIRFDLGFDNLVMRNTARYAQDIGNTFVENIYI
jgi:hypothetical protein